MSDPRDPPPTPLGPLASSGLGRVVAVLFRPREAFAAIAERPTWVTALAVIVLAAALSTALWVPRIDVEDLLRERMAASGRDVSAAQLDQVIEMTDRLRWVMFLGPVLVLQPIMLAVAAALFYVVFRISGSEQRYLQSLAVTVHAFLPLAVAALLAIPLLLGLESIATEDVMGGGVLASNLGFLAPEDASPVVRTLLQSLDFFSLWTVVLLTIGFTRSTRLPNPTVVVSVTAMWGLWILSRVGFASIAT